MAISRNSTASGTNDSSSFSITIAGSVVVSFITYSNGSTLTASSLGGVSGTILRTENIASEGYKISTVSYISTFSGSNSVSFTWSGGTPANIRSSFLGYNGSKLIDASNSLADTSGTVSTTVNSSGCWVVGASYCTVAGGASVPSTGTNNDGYFATTGTNNGLLRMCIGDSNATVSSGSQNVTTTTSGGYTFGKFIIALDEKVDTTLTLTQASFALTGYSAVIYYSIHYVLSLARGSFTLTGRTLAFILRLYTRYTNQTKNTISPVNITKPASSSFTNAVKTNITPTNIPKP